jgi:hypothetical protein
MDFAEAINPTPDVNLFFKKRKGDGFLNHLSRNAGHS